MEKDIRNMTPEERVEHVHELVRKTSRQYQKMVASMTIDDVIEDLDHAIKNAPEPEAWTEQQQNEIEVMERTISWLHLHRGKLAESQP